MRENRAQRCIFFAGASAALFFLWPLFMNAAMLTSRSDALSREQVSTAANHQIAFVTPTGVDAPTDTIIITIPSAFDVSAVVIADVGLTHGPLTGAESADTLAATPAVGVWGAAISGNTITLTAPSDAAVGTISAGDTVIIKIGTQVGTHQITNPSESGVYLMSISGVFGDQGTMLIPIQTSDAYSVSATVVATTPNPGPGPGPAPDRRAPTISNIKVVNITTSTAAVTWTTDEDSDSTINFGVTPAYGDAASSGNLVLQHSLTIKRLLSGTLYHFSVSSRDTDANLSTAEDLTFRTAALPAPPIIANLRVENITDHSAVVLWETDQESTGRIDYGTVLPYAKAVEAQVFGTQHMFTLSSLNQRTLYHFSVSSENRGGLKSVSLDRTFTTLATTVNPTNVSEFIAVPGDALVRLSWKNPQAAWFDRVVIMARTDHHPVDENDGRRVYQGSGRAVIDRAVVNGVTYYYTVFAFAKTGERSSGAVAQAKPEGLKGEPNPNPKPEPTPNPNPQPEPKPKTGSSQELNPISNQEPSPFSTLEIQPHFFDQSGTIALHPDAGKTIGIGEGRNLLVELSPMESGTTFTSAEIRIGSSSYALSFVGAQNLWRAVVAASDSGLHPLTIRAESSDGRTAIATFSILVQPAGAIHERTLAGKGKPIERAAIAVFEMRGGAFSQFDGSPSGQANPQWSQKNGSYGLTVPNGYYELVITHEGYATATEFVAVSHAWLSKDIELVPLPTPLISIIKPEEDLLANARALAKEVKPRLISAVADLQRKEVADMATSVLIPTAIAFGALNALTAASAFHLLNFLQFLFTQPLLLFWRRKRRAWGIVYNSLSKQPVDLAVVRLIFADKNILIQTRITDAQGRFSFLARPGRYRLEVVKAGFVFPSQYLAHAKTDISLPDLYHGEVITVKEASAIAVNIPLDPLESTATPRKILVMRALRRAQNSLGWASVVITAIALFISPSWMILALLVLQLVLHMIFRRLSLPLEPKGWGIIYDKATRSPLERAVVRIFDKRFNKLLETKVTDKDGKYGFFARKSVYFVTAEKSGYARYTSDEIDLTHKDETLIDHNIALQSQGLSVA